MRFRWFIAIGLTAATVLFATTLRDRTPLRTEFCTAQVGKLETHLDLEQGRWSALMAAIAQRRGLPPRATTIAIATAFQESKIYNIDYGDRDSVGLFQQRPSQGWGTVEQVSDPYYSIGAFYDALEKVDGYPSMKVTVAAQKVQRSAHPGAYAQHEDYARALASSLRGYSPAKFSCQINLDVNGDSDAVLKDIRAAFGEIDAVKSGDDVRFPLSGRRPDVDARGWGLAHYLVANASNLGIREVNFDRRTWTAASSNEGWTKSAAPTDVVTASTN